MSEPVLLIGVGNRYRRDDGAGLELIRRLKIQLTEGIDAMESDGEGTSLMESWLGRKTVFLFDAVNSGHRPGTIHRVDPNAQVIRTGYFRCSTHDFGVAEAIELARTFNELPSKLIIYGIEGKDFSQGQGLSREVEMALGDLTAELARVLTK